MPLRSQGEVPLRSQGVPLRSQGEVPLRSQGKVLLRSVTMDTCALHKIGHCSLDEYH